MTEGVPWLISQNWESSTHGLSWDTLYAIHWSFFFFLYHGQNMQVILLLWKSSVFQVSIRLSSWNLTLCCHFEVGFFHLAICMQVSLYFSKFDSSFLFSAEEYSILRVYHQFNYPQRKARYSWETQQIPRVCWRTIRQAPSSMLDFMEGGTGNIPNRNSKKCTEV